VGAALYNLAMSRSTAKQRRDDERRDNVCLLAARTDQRVTDIESRLASFLICSKAVVL
jgi:hypothetical protein